MDIFKKLRELCTNLLYFYYNDNYYFVKLWWAQIIGKLFTKSFLSAFKEWLLSRSYFSTLLTLVISSRPPRVKIIPPNEQTATSPQRFSIGAIVLHSL